MSTWAKCQSCGGPMRWGLTTRDQRMPLDPEPTREGNVWIRPDGRLRVLSNTERQRALDAGQALYLPHHATCPSAARHRKVSREQMGMEL